MIYEKLDMREPHHLRSQISILKFQDEDLHQNRR